MEDLKQTLEKYEASQEEDQAERFSLFPIRDEESYAFWKKQEAMMWNSNEMDFSRDRNDYAALSPDKRRLVDMVFAFFSVADGIVIENIALRFQREAPTLEAKAFYIYQTAIELVHSETYSLTINSIVPVGKREELFRAANNMECVRLKNEWMKEYMLSTTKSLAARLLAFAFAEGVFFMSAFLYIFFFRQEGVLQNVIFANEQISKDEGLHKDYAVMRYKREKVRLSQEEAEDIAKAAVELEIAFSVEALPAPIGSLDPKDSANYIRLLADRILEECGHDPVWNVSVDSIPAWMGEISRAQKGNFYEVRNGNYSNSNLERALDWKGRVLGFPEPNYKNPEEVDF